MPAQQRSPGRYPEAIRPDKQVPPRGYSCGYNVTKIQGLLHTAKELRIYRSRLDSYETGMLRVGFLVTGG